MAAVEPALTVGGESEAGLQILGGEVGKVGEDFLLGHPTREVVEDIIDRDAKPADARLAPALVGFDRDDVLVIHRGETCPSAMGWQDLLLVGTPVGVDGGLERRATAQVSNGTPVSRESRNAARKVEPDDLDTLIGHRLDSDAGN